MTRIAVLGLGAMGSRMAARLLAAGHEVNIQNRTPERGAALEAQGARPATTPREAVAGAEVVIAMLRDDAASRDVWLNPETGALGGLGEGALAIESSTLTPGWVRDLAPAVAAARGRFLEAPVAGSRPQAEAGQLIYFLGGEAEVVAAARPVLESLGGALHHVGACGNAAVVKLAVNALFGIQVAAVAEILGLFRKAGLDAESTAAVLAETPVASPAAKGAAGLMLTGNFAPMFPIDLVEKDFGYVADAASAAGAEMPTAAAVRGIYAHAKAQGFGRDNIAGVAQLFT
ncbi:MAG: NAD(P)-dependent oxidoreductase [Kiloniellales bacterium]|nr:NAD(P)-dependent oxidoreductase [Kiloniellales bacterium]